MSSKNYVVDSGFFPAQKAGFLYETGAGQRFLKSKKSGFAATDTAATAIEAATVDWTDGKNTVTWHGVHRYSWIDFDYSGQVICRNKKQIPLSLAGVVCGAAFKNGVFIVFDYTTTLYCNFFNSQKVLLGSVTIGSYDVLLQHVCVSPDCTKAAFIACPIGLDGVISQIVELSIDLANKQAAITQTTTQSVEDTTDYYQTNYSRGNKSVVVAVDYDSTNTKKDFYIASAFSHTVIDTYNSDTPAMIGGVLYIPTGWSYVAGVPNDPNNSVWKLIWTQSTENTATIDYNGELAGGVDYFSGSDNTRYYLNDGNDSVVGTDWIWLNTAAIADLVANDPDNAAFYQSFASTSATTYHDTKDFLLINDLDLRYDLFAYSKCHEVVTFEPYYPDGTEAYKFEVFREFWLKIGVFSTKIKPDFTISPIFYNGITSDDFLTGKGVPLSDSLFWLRVNDLTTPNAYTMEFSVFIQFEVFTLFVKQYSYTINQNTHYTNGTFILKRVSLPLTDRFKNRLMMFQTVSGIKYSTFADVEFSYNPLVFLKIDTNNNVLSNDIVELKGVV